MYRDIWYDKIPGCLTPSVNRDPGNEDMVHDLLIFASRLSLEAHVNKTDEKLVHIRDHVIMKLRYKLKTKYLH